MGAPDLEAPRATGIWTLAGDRLIIVDADGPATITVPTEQVRLLEVDLPVPTRAKRLAALPFAIEDQIAEPLDTVHIAMGREIAPKRHIVGVVGHAVMARWVEIAEANGLGHAAIVPDIFALPPGIEEEWRVRIDGARVLVRTGHGGFAGPLALLRSAYDRDPYRDELDLEIVGDPLPPGLLPDGFANTAAGYDAASTRMRLVTPELDLRQGLYARDRAAGSALWRRLCWIVALGTAAHIAIAAADTLMLRSIADRRAADTRALLATAAPGMSFGEDLAGEVTGLLPAATSARPDAFIPLMTRVSGALGPLAGAINMRSISFQGSALTMDVEGSDPGLAARIDAALKGARVAASVTTATDGSIRITASGV